MKILFDHNLPRRLREHLPGHEIYTTREMKWEQLRNGALISIAAETGFEVFVTITDRASTEPGHARADCGRRGREIERPASAPAFRTVLT